MKLKNILLIMVFCLMGLTGCSSLNYRLYNKTKIDAQLTKLQDNTNKKLEENQSLIEKKYQNIIDTQIQNEQTANTYFYGIISISDLKNPKTRFDDLIYLKARAGFSMLPAPKPEVLIAENESIKKELDTTQTSLSDLQKKYDQVDKENSAKQQEIIQSKAQLEQLKADQLKITQDAKNQEHDLQEVRNKASNLELAKKDNDLKSAKSDKERRDKLTYIFAGIGVILILVGLLVFHSPLLSMVGGGFVAFSLFVGTAPDYVLWGVPALLIAAGIGELIYKFLSEKGVGDNLVRAIERFKTGSKDEYDKLLKPILVNENGKYDASGNVIPDPKVDAKIDQKLVDMKLK